MAYLQEVMLLPLCYIPGTGKFLPLHHVVLSYWVSETWRVNAKKDLLLCLSVFPIPYRTQ